MKNYFFSNLSALNTDLNYAVDAASSLSGYATKSDLLVATTHIDELSNSLSGTQVQMALYDGKFALDETVVQWNDGTVQLYDLSGVDFDILSSTIQRSGFAGIHRITFGNKVTNINIGPDITWLSSGTLQLNDDSETLSAKAAYLILTFGSSLSFKFSEYCSGFGFYLGGSVLSTEETLAHPTNITDYKFDKYVNVFNPFAFEGWTNLKSIEYPFAYSLIVSPHFIDNCQNLEVLDLRKVPSIYQQSRVFKVGRRTITVYYDPTIENVNPNLKIIVSDSVYTTLMANSKFSTWHPYLVKVSDWESPHNSDLSSYATETYVDTKIGDINTILDSVNGQII